MRGHGGKKAFFAYALLCAVILSSCNGGENISSASDTTASVTVVSDTNSAEISESESLSETTSADSSEITSESVSDTAETEVSATGTAPEQTYSDTDITETTASETTGSSTASAESDTVLETGVPTTAAPIPSETPKAASTTSAKPAEVIIPDVKVPLANGTSVFSEEKAEIDYGNASDGYISVVYKGSSAQAKLRIANGSVQYDHDISADGTRDFIPLMGSGSYSVKVYEHISGKNFAPILSGEFEVSIKNENNTYLYPNKYVNYGKNSECVKKAAEVCAGKSGDVEEIAAIFEYVSDNISYDKQLAATVQSGYVPNPDKTLAAGKGICFDYASLFAAMCRSRSIPARLVIGYADPNIYHAWNEVYTDETGWITPELFLKKKGYNIADATFYSSNSDKKKIADYISDDGNYSAIYRY